MPAQIQQDPQALCHTPCAGERDDIIHFRSVLLFRLIQTFRNTLISMMNRKSTRPMENSALPLEAAIRRHRTSQEAMAVVRNGRASEAPAYWPHCRPP